MGIKAKDNSGQNCPFYFNRLHHSASGSFAARTSGLAIGLRNAIHLCLSVIALQAIKQLQTGVLIALVLIVSTQLAFAAERKSIKIGVLAEWGVEKCMRAWSPTAHYLSYRVPDVEIEIVPFDYTEIETAVQKASVEFILTDPMQYVTLEAKYGASRIATLKKRRLGRILNATSSVIFVKSDRTDITKIEDLRGKRVMGVKEGSLEGWVAAWREFKAIRLDPHKELAALNFGNTPDSVVYAVRDGRADAGVVGSGHLEQMARESKLRFDHYKVLFPVFQESHPYPFLHSTRTYPEWPLARLKDTSIDLAEKISVAIIRMPADAPAAVASQSAGWTVPSNYQQVHDALKELKIGPYADLGSFSLKDVTYRYRTELIILVLFISAVMLAAGYFLRLNLKIRRAYARLEREVEERMRTEAKLKASEIRFQDISLNMVDWIWETDMSGKFVYSSENVKNVLGYDRDEVVGKSPLVFLIPEDARRTKGIYTALKKEKGALNDLVTWHLKKDGSRVCLQTSGVPMIGTEGQLIGYRGVAKDITETIEADAKILQALNETETIINHVPVGIVIVGRDRTIRRINSAALKILGYTTSNEVIGKSCNPTICPLEPGNCLTNDAGQPVDQSEQYMLGADGNAIPVLKTEVLTQINDEEAIIGAFMDIRKLKAAEKKLKNKTMVFRRLSQAISQSPVSVVITDAEGIIEYVNPKFSEVTGYSYEETLGQNPRILKSELQSPEFYREMWSTLKSGRQWTGELHNKKKNGQLFWERAHISPVHDRTGKIVSYIALKEDITRQKEIAEALRVSEARHRTVMEACADPIVVYDSQGRVSHFNNAFTVVFGWTLDELKGKRIEFVPKEAEEETGLAIQRVLSGQIVTGFETRRFRKDGEVVDVRLGAALLKDANNEPVGLVVNFQDITEQHRKTMEINNLNAQLQEAFDQVNIKREELEKAMDQLKKTQAQVLQSEKMASIGQLAAGVAHEINNPTGFVSSNLKTLVDYQNDLRSLISEYREAWRLLSEGNGRKALPEEIKLKLSHISELEEDIDIDFVQEDIQDLICDCREGTDRIKKIVMDLKDFAHPGEDRMHVTDINKGLESTLNVVKNEVKYKATVTTDLGDLPMVPCYPQQLNQVFMNILVNAAQAIETQGEIIITTRPLDDQVEISISDTGTGIAAKNLSKIFDPFFTTKDVGKGTGLGMNIAYNIIKKHNGTIDVQSAEGQGTTFTIRIPVGEE